METVLAWLSQYGYGALFGLLMVGIVGIPVPDETLLVFSGYLISRGQFQPLLTFAVSFAGSVCGISLSYYIGRTAGYQAAHRYGKYVHLTEERLDRVHHLFQRIGNWLLMLGYFIPGVRHFSALVAGMSKLRYRRFAIFAYAGAALWVASFLTLGYVVGENWPAVMAAMHRYTLATLVTLVAAASLVWLIHRQVRMRFRS